MMTGSRTPPDADSSAEDRKRRLPIWKKVIFAVGCLVLTFTGLELLLAVIGVRPVLFDEDPYVGFSSQVPLFVEQSVGSDLVMATAANKLAWFNPQQFPRRKSTGVYRIFCVGGSTTYGRPYDDATSFAGSLREFLPEADRSRRWEVVNAGGISYASYRVAKLMEELIQYEPDLFVIYSGHNEFLERRTYGSLFDSSSVVDRLGGPLGRTRTYAALRRLFRGGRPAAASATSSSPFELPREATALLDESIGPEDYSRDDAAAQQILAHYRFNLSRMIEIARSVEADVMLVTPACNLRNASPFKSEPAASLAADEREELERLHQQAVSASETGDLETALQTVDLALQIDDRFADLHFLRGRVLLNLARPADAKVAFLRAREEDVCPLRALSTAIEMVRDVAARENVPLVDYVAIVDQIAEEGIPGSDLFLDHVHPTIAGNRLLAEHLLNAMVTAGIVRLEESWGRATIDRIAARIEGRLDHRKQGIALRNLAKVLGWAGKLEEAGRLAQRAVELVPDDAEAQFEAGVSAEDRNDLAAAETHYRRAKELAPQLVQVSINLGVVLAKQEQLQAAEAEFQAGLTIDPQSGVLYANLARVKALQGDFASAVEDQRTALQLAPVDRRSELLATLREFEQQLVASPAPANDQ